MEDAAATNITVLIAGRPYPLKIKVGDEPVIRNIVKEVNDKINQFQLTYTKKDKQDCLSMALLTYAVDLHKAQQAPQAEDFSEKIEELDNLLSHLLK